MLRTLYRPTNSTELQVRPQRATEYVGDGNGHDLIAVQLPGTLMLLHLPTPEEVVLVEAITVHDEPAQHRVESAHRAIDTPMESSQRPTDTQYTPCRRGCPRPP